MSLYMSKSLDGKIDMSIFSDNNSFKVVITERSHLIKRFNQENNNNILIEFKALASTVENLISNKIENKDIHLNWIKNNICGYKVLSLEHVLENEIDNYIINLNLQLED